MAFDQTKLGQLTTALMDQLEQEFDEDAELGDAILIVEVRTPDEATVHLQTSDLRSHVNFGLLEIARRILDASLMDAGPDADSEPD